MTYSPKMTFINIPVQDLERSKKFFLALDMEFKAEMTNDEAGCLVVNENTYIMLLTHPFYSKFIRKGIANSSTSELILSLSADSREHVHEIVGKALEAGASEPIEAQDMGFMFTRSFEDLDGHLFEVMFYDPAAAAEAFSQEQEQ
ncbi:VOC family protein [Paenibacillus herberti]|uniref:Glyoxalase/bleomycin resistance/extradiol dioxygenase family protein n=1 Tax=Paenibacillus herberti TaxID=1619309 RepID=A0A229NUI7_9BACL|nr:VOC family protein [Paenibacillus herberti]OXM13385.1 glyoxalase/bleomycin resistance/extradiol dioxygenase family protein [Paenibacillus herberti]